MKFKEKVEYQASTLHVPILNINYGSSH